MPVKRIAPGENHKPMPIMRPSLPRLEDYVKRIRKIWVSRMLSNFGENARELERRAQDYLGNPNVRAVSSCDIALLLGLAALRLKPGSKCIVTPFTFNSTVNAIIWNGLKPEFVDIDPATFNIDPDRVRDSISKDTSAIVATHVFGNPCRIDVLREIADRNDIPLVFDAAHAYGSIYNGKKVGTFGDIEVFSLSGTKLVTSAEGGLLASTNPEIAERLEFLRGYGFKNDYNSLYVGLNGKISELNAALGCLTIDTIENAVRRRNKIARIYSDELADLGVLSFQSIGENCRCAYKDFGIRVFRGRSRVEAELKKQNIQTKRYFLPLHRMPAYREFRCRRLPQTERLYEEIICIPIFNEMNDSMAKTVSRAIERSLKPE